MMLSKAADVVVVGAGAAGIGTGVVFSLFDLETVVLERDEIGASFRGWPMRCDSSRCRSRVTALD
ncbi:hypothetical protein AArcMg_3433 [Natrarchaeobaculum sulfurireducens]|uniref:Thioredoxin reductase n=1 Tax=Natrarchaeobaculum sulfurireducens TaxID=2044521 RepID=A0A346PJH4_9EURY|nr:NAD(P)-binding domain-containing protein [Natrarchaeobaculum sulfurireducens]AXR79669.1 Thioredoxin reductase [Natrarchaeobaculum sulfurireducens]AXR83412.1 hypothetical protein AArcMg_3433 [Natrarchaeobaculum sulfurireducens]